MFSNRCLVIEGKSPFYAYKLHLNIGQVEQKLMVNPCSAVIPKSTSRSLTAQYSQWEISLCLRRPYPLELQQSFLITVLGCLKVKSGSYCTLHMRIAFLHQLTKVRGVWSVPLPPLKILVAWLCLALTFEQTCIKRGFENCWNFYEARDSRKITAKASAWQPANLDSQRRGQQWKPPNLSHERATLRKNLTQRKYRQYLQQLHCDWMRRECL